MYMDNINQTRKKTYDYIYHNINYDQSHRYQEDEKVLEYFHSKPTDVTRPSQLMNSTLYIIIKELTTYAN